MSVDQRCPDVPVFPEEEEDHSKRAPHSSDHSIVPVIECDHYIGDHHEEERVYSYGKVQSQSGENIHPKTEFGVVRPEKIQIPNPVNRYNNFHCRQDPRLVMQTKEYCPHQSRHGEELTEEDNWMQVGGHSIESKKEHNEVEESEREVSSHDVPEPVQTRVRAPNAFQVEGVGQGVVVVLTSPAESAISLQRATHRFINLPPLLGKRVIDSILQMACDIAAIPAVKNTRTD